MQIKLLCSCGTKFAFDVEPVDGRMPAPLLCPSCQLECTEYANAYIAQVLAVTPPVPSIKVPVFTPPPSPSPALPPPPPVTAPAPALAPAPVAEAPALSSKLRVTRTAHTPPAAPAAPAIATPAEPTKPVAAPKPGGLGVSRKASEPVAPPAAATPPPPSAEGVPEDDSFAARRAKRLAEAQGKQVATHQEWGKTLRVIRVASVLLIIFIGVAGWYSFIGSAPATYYYLPSSEGSYGTVAKLFSPDELVVANGKGISLHDLKSGQPRWTTTTKSEGGGEDDDNRYRYGSDATYLHLTDKDIWAAQNGKLHQLDPLTGKAQKQIPINGQVTEFAVLDKNLTVVSQSRGQHHVMVVNLATGDTKTETFGTAPKEKIVAQVKGNEQRPATSGNLLKQELEGDDEFSAFSKNTLYASAGDHAVRVDIKITETNFTRVKVMRDAPKQSKLNSKTSIMSNPLGIAGEVFNDIKRSDGGQFQSVDMSTYQVIISRRLKDGESVWQGEIKGEPTYYSGKTVDLVVGHQDVIILSKANKLIAQKRLNFPTGEMGGLAFRREENAPFLETADTLYFWDKGTLTAFALATGEKRWEFENVGITSVVADDNDGVYVCGTTATTDSIQFSEEVSLENRPRTQFFKLDARSGKKEWECKEGSKDVYLTGKFLYTTRPAGSTLGMMGGDDSAGRTFIHRVNPRNGKIEWELEYKGDIDRIHVFLNRLAITSDGEVKVLKFLSL
ncbi:MAG: hypothetical protein K0Q55_833 [Verrucomicrobia bacterium]|nr:hypothetical protein [Verrucomicrobiota bacterium]